MNEHKTSFPLCWPDGWPRTLANQRQTSKFIRSRTAERGPRAYSMEEARTFLALELQRLGAGEAILSTNCKLRLDGQPWSGLAQPSDVGAAVYFTLKRREVSLACDKWRRIECNIFSIAKHIEALRAQQRWGVGNVEQAFRGYMALPALGQSTGDNPWQVLGVTINASEQQVQDAYRALAKKFHPDNPATGDRECFQRVQDAYNLLAQNFRANAAHETA